MQPNQEPTDQFLKLDLAGTAGPSVVCPRCGHRLPAEDFNVATDVAICKRCDVRYTLTEILDTGPRVDLRRPPNGVFFEERPDGFEFSANTRSWQAAGSLFLIAMLVVGARQTHPSQLAWVWFWNAIFLVFLLPTFVMQAAGHVTVTLKQGRFMLFRGVGPLGWRRSFAWTDFDRVLDVVVRDAEGAKFTDIELIGVRSVKFGRSLNSAARFFLTGVLRHYLHARAIPR